MTFTKTFCSDVAGSYVEVVPLGLLGKVQYNKNGIVEKIYLGFSDDAVECEMHLFKALCKFIPGTIPLSGGTTWVEGVFYTDNISHLEGTLPECTYQDYAERAVKGEQFEFYAGRVESLSASFNGSLSIRNWLSIAKFKLLPGIIAPLTFNESTMQMMLTTGAYKFKYPYMAGLMVYDAVDYRYIPSNIKQITVQSVTKSTDQLGYITGKVYGANSAINLNYSDVVSYDIQKGSSVLYQEIPYPEVLDVFKISGLARKKLSADYECPVCHKRFALPATGPVKCDDSHCLSRCYPDVLKLLTVLNLPILNYKDYTKAVKEGQILTATDVLLLPQYRELKLASTLSKIIQSVTPVEVCANVNFFDQLAEVCNYSVETLIYYIKNPLRAQTDFSINDPQALRFFEWVEDPYNLLSIQTVLGIVDVVNPEPKLSEEAPILRGRSFKITGTFLHGNLNTVTNILRSYSGNVLSNDDKSDPDMVIVGDVKEDIDGALILESRNKHIPVVDESEFFNSINSL